MSWISLVCLLALSSSAFGYSAYGSFSGRMLVKPKLTLPVPSPIPQPAPIENYQATNTYGSSQGSVPSFPTFERPKAPTNPLTEFDIMCRGKTPETIIVLGEGERWVICLDDSKGVEQWCPKDLILNLESRECKPKYKKTKDYCAAQPCLNGGQCFLTEYSFECKCTPGYEGKHCELDARICQTQRPCGEGAICQSFHARCELQHVCIFQDGLSYGLNSQQVHSNPCLVRSDIHPLAFSNRGYITCNGEEMFIHACPGGTIWDSVTKICVWPEMEGLFSKTVEPVVNKYGSSSYGSEQLIEKVTLPPQVPSYSTPALPVVPVEVPRPVELPKVPVQPVSSYGSQIQFPTERSVIQTQPQLVQQPQWMQRVQMPSTMPKMLPIQRSSGY